MQCHHARMNVVAREEIARVIEDYFIIVIVVVEERNFDGAGIGFEWPRHERAYHETLGDEGRMRRRRQMIAVAHERTDVAHVDARYAEIAVPADGVEWIERIRDGGDSCAALDAHLPARAVALLRVKCSVELRYIEHCSIKERMRSDEPFLRQAIAELSRINK